MSKFKFLSIICLFSLLLVGCKKQSDGGNTVYSEASKNVSKKQSTKNDLLKKKVIIANKIVSSLNSPNTKIKVVKSSNGALAVNDVVWSSNSNKETYAYTTGTEGVSITNFAQNKNLGQTGVNAIQSFVSHAYNKSNDSISDASNLIPVGSDPNNCTYNYVTFNGVHIEKNPKGYGKGTVVIEGNVILNYTISGQEKTETYSTSKTQNTVISDTKIETLRKKSLKRIDNAKFKNVTYPNNVMTSQTHDAKNDTVIAQ
ncbi:hypothetical protein FC19_GL001806 [Liquorilactobacillus aquaticus DSM 21051]|uniref:Lipoprotein n=1 Tax=Liquorilactobacillus aquaticus DSM 21051 TaxID=1423725 RepID=A0A0R2D0S2_9LACO|nr:hypothetical protein [Liquorilactobacillus aquaticus]KRM95492.1 hypothetical protein FC19_GL001806 [Liquorilactobacillus aquaticus DSM 21051]